MDAEHFGELVWHRGNGSIVLSLLLPGSVRTGGGGRSRLAPLIMQGWTLRPITSTAGLNVVFRQPIALRWEGSNWVTGPVFAILAASEPGTFSGSKANFRDIMRAATSTGKFMYVIPSGNVTKQAVWRGFVRLGYQRWVAVPCPRPQAVYNRVPTRNLERSPSVVSAKRVMHSLDIPVFNPEYFNKKVIYAALERSPARVYLPETKRLESANALRGMLRNSPSVYLKPTGGSIGHGIMRVDARGAGAYQLRVLKNGRCDTFGANGFDDLWVLVRKHRLPGEYVLQAGKNLIRHQGRPCDFRILAQKNQKDWQVTGIGVRVAGPDTITTHVPNGGFIAKAASVLGATFGDRADEVERALRHMIRECATAIDAHYRGQLGEMSMDVGLDEGANMWFFEANSKPMKFDEPDIREMSIRGVLHHLEYLATR